MSREDAALKEYFATEGSAMPARIGYILEAADAHDAANKMVRVSWDDLKAVRDDAWKRGYEACREGKQKHSPYSAS